MQPSNRGPLHKEEGRGRYEGKMKAVVHAYAEVMKLIRHLRPRMCSYYFQFAWENFITYSQEQVLSVIRSLLLCAPSSVAKFPRTTVRASAWREPQQIVRTFWFATISYQLSTRASLLQPFLLPSSKLSPSQSLVYLHQFFLSSQFKSKC
jgi:hypothetical protein